MKAEIRLGGRFCYVLSSASRDLVSLTTAHELKRSCFAYGIALSDSLRVLRKSPGPSTSFRLGPRGLPLRLQRLREPSLGSFDRMTNQDKSSQQRLWDIPECDTEQDDCDSEDADPDEDKLRPPKGGGAASTSRHKVSEPASRTCRRRARRAALGTELVTGLKAGRVPRRSRPKVVRIGGDESA